MNSQLKYIDLFAGAGGLSEGFIRAGFEPIAHVEMDKSACDTLRTRIAFHWLRNNGLEKSYYDYLRNASRKKEDLWKKVPQNLIDSVINEEISDDTLSHIFSKIDSNLNSLGLDLIIGGPPCQAYSVIGRARDSQNMKNDPRNSLYKYYAKFLERYRPKMFIFENVLGILSAKNGQYISKIFQEFENIGYKVALPDRKYLNAKHFGVLQDRKRVIIMGWRQDLDLEYPQFHSFPNNFSVLKDLFSDLPFLKSGWDFLDTSYTGKPTIYLRTAKIRNDCDVLTQHSARYANENDLEIYSIAAREWSLGKRLDYDNLPTRLIRHKNLHSFKNRFQVVNGQGVSHTIVAHIAKDGHYYIHPDPKQNRSITIREAARIQSFPDDYFFEGSRTSAFKQIGNAVPVLMAEKIAVKVKEILSNVL